LSSYLDLFSVALIRFISKLLRRQKSLSDSLSLELSCHILELFRKLTLDFSLAECWQVISILRRAHLEGHASDTLLLAKELVKGDNLVKETHCVKVSVALPHETGGDLAEGFAPLLNS
jgi:hypothetical protein